jgi:hypothetical protein
LEIVSNERFGKTLRREVPIADSFNTTKQAQVVIILWLIQCNYIRPYLALSMQSPVPRTLIENGIKLDGSTPSTWVVQTYWMKE